MANRVLRALEGLTERKMLGGIAFMPSGNMGYGVTNDELMIRIGTDGLEDALAQPYARPTDFKAAR